MITKCNGRYELVVQSDAKAKKKTGANGFACMELILLGSAQPLHLANTEVETPGLAKGLYSSCRIRHEFGLIGTLC